MRSSERKVFVGGVLGITNDPAYVVAMAGLLGFTKSTARYLGQYNLPPTASARGLRNVIENLKGGRSAVLDVRI